MSVSCSVHQQSEAVGTCVGCGKFFCSNCMREIKGKNYCNKCGDELYDQLSTSQSGNIVINNTNSSASNVVGGYPVRRYNRSKIVAGILAIFLGNIGVHKFYLGRVGQGILYILFCWTFIPGLIGFIEGIIYLANSEQAFDMKYNY